MKGLMAAGAASLALLGAALALPGVCGLAEAAGGPPQFLTSFGGPEGLPGKGAGELNNPRGIAVDSRSGHVYVAEATNRRISEFSPWGRFVKAFGWNVAAGAVNEQQEVRVRAAAGQFRLSFEGVSTPDLAYDASAEDVQSALNTLSTIGGAGGETLVTEFAGDPSGATPYVFLIAFKGAMAGADVEELVATEGVAPLEGGSPSTTLEARTIANGVGAAHVGLEACTGESGCQAGARGGGVGQLNNPQGLDSTSDGDLYVADLANGRVQKFSPAGEFLLMIGGNVNKGGGTPEAPGNICTASAVANGDDCTGVASTSPGTGAGEFGPWEAGDFLDVDADDVVYVGDENRIQKFDSGGAWSGDITVPGCGFVLNLAVAPSGDIYTGCQEILGVDKRRDDGSAYGAPYPLLAEGTGTGGTSRARALAVDAAGDLYVALQGPASIGDRVGRFSGSGEEGPTFGGLGFKGTGLGNGLAAAADCPPPAAAAPGDVYASYHNGFVPIGYVSAFGPPPLCFETPPPAAPGIAAQFAASVGTESAALRARINPRFWQDTSYFVEYGTEACGGGGCPNRAPAGDAGLGGGSTNSEVETPAVVLEGLEPDTTYHYRFVARSSGGGPSVGPERRFTTFAPPIGMGPCANEARRSGPSARLPDCRAYELVSPLDKNGGDVQALSAPLTTTSRYTSYKQAAEAGGKVTYSSATAFGDAPSGPFSSQYVSRRGAGGWSTEAISAPRGTAIFEGSPQGAVTAAFSLRSLFEAFTPELDSAWLIDDNLDPLGDGIAGYTNLLREEVGTRSFAALTNEGPYGLAAEYLNERFEPCLCTGYGPGLRFAGFSEDLDHQVFSSAAALTADAAPVEPECQATVAGATLSRQWLANGEPIAGETDFELTLGEAQQGKAIQCEVRTKSLFGPQGTVGITGPSWVATPTRPREVPEAPLAGIPAPTSSEALEVGGPGGQTLTCDPRADDWFWDPQSFAFRWYRNGTPIEGSEEATHTLQAADLATAAAYQCVVKATSAGGATSAASETLLTDPEPFPQTPRASGLGTKGARTQLYDLHDGRLELVSVLPGGEADPGNSYAGTLEGRNREANVHHAVSDDGERIFWSSNPASGSGPGKIYARIGGEVTLPISAQGEEESAMSASRYWDAAADGSKALFTSGEDLYLFDVDKALAEEPGATTPIAGKVAGVAGAADDLSYVYFASRESLAEGAEADRYNLYVYHAGALALVAVLGAVDAGSSQMIGPVAHEPINRASRVSPDGRTIAFQALGQLTGYDNLNPSDGKRYSEVYRYSAPSHELTCVSCNPTGATPSGLGKLAYSYSVFKQALTDDAGTAALLPTWEREHHASRLLSDDGRRVFFESYERLVPRDSNGARDVYEWEAAESSRDCEALGATLYSPASGGCLSLISTGSSTQDSEFVDASADGGDAFFSTTASLDPRDTGLIDVYDARVGGGFSPEAEPAACEGEACQSPPPAPSAGAPASMGFKGPGNLRAEASSCVRAARRAAGLARRARAVRGRAARAGTPRRSRRLQRRSARVARRAKATSKRAKRCRRAERKRGGAAR